MKNKMRHLLISAAVAAVLLCVESSSGLCRAQSLPDLRIRMIKVTGQHEVTVVVANYGHADSLGCYVTLYLLNPSDKKEIWSGRESVKPLTAMSSVDVAFNMGRARPGGLLLRAMADSSQRVKEENEDNNWGELLVPADTKPKPTPPPAVSGSARIAPPWASSFIAAANGWLPASSARPSTRASSSR